MFEDVSGCFVKGRC